MDFDSSSLLSPLQSVNPGNSARNAKTSDSKASNTAQSIFDAMGTIQGFGPSGGWQSSGTFEKMKQAASIVAKIVSSME